MAYSDEAQADFSYVEYSTLALADYAEADFSNI